MNKEMKELKQVVEEHGWWVEERRSGHLVIKGPDGQQVFCSATPSDHRAVRNIQRDLAHQGLDIR